MLYYQGLFFLTGNKNTLPAIFYRTELWDFYFYDF